MAWVSTWFYAAHRLLSAWEHGQASYGHQTPVWLKFRLAFSSSRTTSWTLFRNLHTAAKRSRGVLVVACTNHTQISKNKAIRTCPFITIRVRISFLMGLKHMLRVPDR